MYSGTPLIRTPECTVEPLSLGPPECTVEPLSLGPLNVQ